MHFMRMRGKNTKIQNKCLFSICISSPQPHFGACFSCLVAATVQIEGCFNARIGMNFKQKIKMAPFLIF